MVRVDKRENFYFEEANYNHQTGMGYNVAEDSSKVIEEVLEPEIARSVSLRYKQAVKTGTKKQYPELHRTKLGIVNALTTIFPIAGAGGNIERILGVSQCVSIVKAGVQTESASASERQFAKRPGDANLLTPREREVLELASYGLTSFEIGKRLSIAERTAIAHLAKATSKLGASNRTSAVALALRCGLIAS